MADVNDNNAAETIAKADAGSADTKTEKNELEVAKAEAVAPPMAAEAVVKAPKPASKKKLLATTAKPQVLKAKPAAKAKPVRATKPAALASDANSKPKPKPTIKQLKDTIMATKNTENSAPAQNLLGDMQARAKGAYDKSTAMAGDMGDFAKGNVEAMVEAGKIMTAGLQNLGRDYAEDAKSAFETMTADMKGMAAIKSPTELFQLQGNLMRRNFDAAVQMASKSSEAMVKLTNEAFAPLSNRMSVAVEKVSKAA